MELRYVTAGGATAAVLEDGFIATVQDALDLIAEASYQGASAVVILTERLSPDFFKTGFAERSCKVRQLRHVRRHRRRFFLFLRATP